MKCGRFWTQVIIASNFLKTGNVLAIAEKYAPTVVLVGAHSFPQFLENFRSHSDACRTLISSKKTRNLKRIDNSTENMSGIAYGHQNYVKWDCKVRILIVALKKQPESER